MVQELKTVSGAFTPSATYLIGASGPTCRMDASAVATFYAYDGLGSVLGEVDGAGNLSAQNAYDVYGARRSTVNTSGTPSTRHGFVGSLGHTTEPESGLIYMRARYYDPSVGRFISEDSQGNGGNWFNYCDSNPTSKTDSTGNTATWVIQCWKALLGDLDGRNLGFALGVGFGMAATILAIGSKWTNRITGKLVAIDTCMALASVYFWAVAFGASPWMGIISMVGGYAGAIAFAYLWAGFRLELQDAMAAAGGMAIVAVTCGVIYCLAIYGAASSVWRD